MELRDEMAARVLTHALRYEATGRISSMTDRQVASICLTAYRVADMMVKVASGEIEDVTNLPLEEAPDDEPQERPAPRV